jgi:hypothetical protein
MPSLVRTHPRGNVLGNLLLQMKPQLVIQSARRTTAPKHHLDPHPQPRQPPH